MRYLIIIFTVFIFSFTLSSVTAQTVSNNYELNSKPQQVNPSRQALQKNIFNILNLRSEAETSEADQLQSDIDARMDIDQRYFQNRFKILSNDTPILYKLYT